MSPDELNRQFGIDGVLRFDALESGLVMAHVNGSLASASLCLQGAQLCHWRPREADEDLLWLSEGAVFEPGAAIRGGIPICWPWFGDHPDDDTLPAHGFARNTPWRVQATELLDSGVVRLALTLPVTDSTRSMWPGEVSLQCIVNIGDKLAIELVTRNHGEVPVRISQALHSYFRVGDIGNVVLHGLAGTEYLDKLDGFARKRQQGPVLFDGEVDRIYLDTVTDCVIEDRAGRRKIVIIKCGSHSTVVWNPWRDTAVKMADMNDDGYRSMLCVESANVADDTVTIEAGKSHHLWVQWLIEQENTP